MSSNFSQQRQGKKFATSEDQFQINKFARLHKNYVEAKEELKLFKNEIQNLEEAANEILLLDDTETTSIPLQIGSVFVHYNQATRYFFNNSKQLFKDDINEKLEQSKTKAIERVLELEDEVKKFEEEKAELKAQLYAKFGDNIHLEDSEE